MPFIDKLSRDCIPETPYAEDLAKILETPGEKCFVFYRRFIREWRKDPRWSTADKLLAHIIPCSEKRAEVLAYLVFFVLHVIPYELEKREEHGEVE